MHIFMDGFCNIYDLEDILQTCIFHICTKVEFVLVFVEVWNDFQKLGPIRVDIFVDTVSSTEISSSFKQEEQKSFTPVE